MREQSSKTGLTLGGALVAALAASLCCILPVIAVALGLTGLAVSQFFTAWRPYLLGVTFALLAAGFYMANRRGRGACESGVCERPAIGRWGRTSLWLVTGLVLVVAAFPYYSGRVAHALARNRKVAAPNPAQSTARVVLTVEGMDCGGCAALLEKNLSRIAGVQHAEVNFEKKQAVVEYDPKKVAPSRFVQVISSAGFKARVNFDSRRVIDRG